MSKVQKRMKACSLRRKGMSLKKIAKELMVSSGSVSVWCRDIELTTKQIREINRRAHKGSAKGRAKGVTVNKNKKALSLQEANAFAQSTIKDMSERDLLFLATGLYWGEGTKTESRFLFTNSDPLMVKVMMRFLVEVMGVDKGDVRVNIQINSVHKKRMSKIENFWIATLGIDKKQIGNPYYIKIKPKKEYSNFQNYYGILRLRVLRSSRLQYKMLELVNVIKTMPR